MNVIGQMTKEQYLTWKNSLLNMHVAEFKSKLSHKMAVIMEKDQEIQRLKCQLYKTETNRYDMELNDIKQEFQDTRVLIEKELGFDLNDCIIDEITLEVKKL